MRVASNFGAIFDVYPNMKYSLTILLFSLAGLCIYGQDKAASKMDLYSCWVMEKTQNRLNSDKLIYKRCNTVNPKMKNRGSEFSLLAYGKTKIQRWHPIMCFTTYTDFGTWTFDKKTGIVTMSYGQDLLEEMKKTNPEKFEKFGSPKQLEWKKFKVLSVSENQMEIK